MRSIKIITILCTTMSIYGSISGQCLDEENVYSFVYNGHSYDVVKEIKTWTEASACAASRNGYLAEIGNEAEQDAIFDELTNNADINILNTENEFGTASVWLGGSDANTEGTWIWDGNNDGIGPPFWNGGPNGSSVGSLYTNWGISPPEPDNSGNQDHLTIIIKPTATNFGLWNDLASTTPIYYLIEYDEVLSIQESTIHDGLTIYPNPAIDYLTIDNNNANDIIQIEVYNMEGQLILTFLKNDFIDQQINIQSLDQGIYVFSFLLEGGKHVNYKVMK